MPPETAPTETPVATTPAAPSAAPATAPVAAAPDAPKPVVPLRSAEAVKALRAQRDLKAAQEELKAERAKREQLEGVQTRWKADPYGVAAKELGIDYKTMTDKVLKGETVAPMIPADVHVDALKQEVADLKSQLDAVKGDSAERAKREAAYTEAQQTLQATQKITEFAKADDRFPLVASVDGAAAFVIAELERYYEEAGEPAPASMLETFVLAAEQQIASRIDNTFSAIAKSPQGIARLRALLDKTAPTETASTKKPPVQATEKKRPNGSERSVTGRFASSSARTPADAAPTRKLPWNRNVHRDASQGLQRIVSDAKGGRV